MKIKEHSNQLHEKVIEKSGEHFTSLDVQLNHLLG